jgi:hypothetical protein
MKAIMLSQIGLETDQVLASWRFLDPATRGILLVFGSIGLVTLLALIWATFFRKLGRRRRKRHHAYQQSSNPAEVPATPRVEDAPSLPETRHHRRRSGRRRRSRNPTLAETGGLPPVRPEGPSEPLA